MTEIQESKVLLRRNISSKKVKLKNVYSLIMDRPIKNRMYKQSEWLCDNFYSGDLNYIAHLYNRPKKEIT